VAAALTALTNPGVVKVFGFALFATTVVIAYELASSLCRAPWSLLAPFLLLCCPVLLNDAAFSFAHQRVYYLLLTTLAVSVLVLGIEARDPRYHYGALVLMGVLGGATLAGLPTVGVCLFVVLVSTGLWLRHKRGYLVGAVVCFLLALPFLVWNRFHAGSPYPANPVFTRALGYEVNPDVFSPYTWDRVALQFVNGQGASLLDYLRFPFLMVREQASGAALVLFLLGLLWVREGVARALYGFVLLSVWFFELMVPASATVRSTSAALRFHLAALPVMCVVVAMAAEKVALGLPGFVARLAPRLSRLPLGGVCKALVGLVAVAVAGRSALTSSPNWPT